MNPIRIILAALCFASCSLSLVQAQEMDKELTEMATELAASIKESSKKKVTVLDFTDLQGGSSELGKYVAEQLTVDLVIAKKDFTVLDRYNLNKILAEHKLTATGLIDPENAKKLGQFAGVDALILGTITPRGQKVNITAKIITTDTAAIVGAAKAEFLSDEAVQQLLSKSADAPKSGNAEEAEDKTKVSKTLGDLRVDIKSFSVAKRDFLMSLDLVNLNPKRSLWVAINTDIGTNVKGGITDASGSLFVTDFREVSGLTVTAHLHDGFFRATEIPPTNSLPTTIRFFSRGGSAATAGSCRFQMEFLTGYNFDGKFGPAKVNNLVTKLQAE